MALHGDSELAEDECTKTFSKVARESKQHGYRDGVQDGKDSVFQKSFDEGYMEGFRAGFSLGKLKGELRVDEKYIDSKDEVLKSTRKGGCKICADGTLLEKPIENIKSEQNERLKDIMNELNTKYNS